LNKKKVKTQNGWLFLLSIKKPRKSLAEFRPEGPPEFHESNRNSSSLGAIFVKYIIIIFLLLCFFFVFFLFVFVSLKFEKSQPFWGKNVSRFGV